MQRISHSHESLMLGSTITLLRSTSLDLAEGKRNKPPTKTQQKKTMITYLKNMEGWKHKDLKSKDFDSIKELFDKALKMVNMFVDFRTELVKETTEVDNDQEAAKINELMEIVPGQEEVKIDAIPLGVKSPSIVFSQMLKSFDRKDLEDLYKLVKAKYESTRPAEDMDLVLWNDLKSTFLKDATYADLNVGRKEVSPCTIYTFTYVGKEASN
ncbi:retrovirus-related pol polyprotein from transposon TNT 1-94 [Tanacetum coccineum]|uniref:Retrovirus-related pol polyprotein from transposon TNT 1-94 n=1 Tax=Tanacetum coccineum TaxID=301880 RepID=A0ABQ4WUD5_9ASTR